MEDRDVIVVGAGPAGSACARALTDEGVDVLVLEKEVLPRYKCCSGVLFGQTQELLRAYFGADAPADVYCSGEKIIEAEDIREWIPGGEYRPYVWEIDKDGRSFSRNYQNIWRDRFDKWLLDQSGAEYRDRTCVQRFDVEAAQVRVRTKSSNGGEGDYRCKYMVGADGGMSVVRRALNRRAAGGAVVAVLQSYFKIKSLGALKKGAWTVFFDPNIGEVFSSVLQKGDYLVLQVGGFPGRKLRESMERFRLLLAEQFDVQLGDWLRDEGCQMELAPPFLGEGRVLLTGEAAGFIYLNGEGISAAIDSGYRCGKTVAQAIRGGKDALGPYGEVTKDIAAHIQRCLQNIHFLASP